MVAFRRMCIPSVIIFMQFMGIAITREQLQNISTDSLKSGEYNNTTESSAESYGNFSQDFLSCLKTLIESEHYQTLENGTVYIPNYSSYSRRGLYPAGDYYVSENGVLVCFPEILITEHKKESNLQEILQYTTVIGLSLSLACLFLHLVLFLLVPEMKNLPGKNVASLALSMFMSNLMFLIGRIGYMFTWTCYPLGLAHYYFMMSSFFWINSISFNVFRSIRQATKKLRLSKVDKVKRFCLYSLYSWGIPAIFLIAVIAGDETSAYPEILKPGFDTKPQICWFNQVWSAVFFFAAPFSILVAVNAIFFLYSAYIISGSVKTNDVKRQKKFFLYLKLAIIMGLGWILGLITYFVSSIYIAFITVLVITFQGVFICVAFTRFSKTKENLQQKYSWFRKSVASSSFPTEDLRFSGNKSSIATVNSISSYRIKTEENKPEKLYYKY